MRLALKHLTETRGETSPRLIPRLRKILLVTESSLQLLTLTLPCLLLTKVVSDIPTYLTSSVVIWRKADTDYSPPESTHKGDLVQMKLTEGKNVQLFEM